MLAAFSVCVLVGLLDGKDDAAAFVHPHVLGLPHLYNSGCELLMQGDEAVNINSGITHAYHVVWTWV